MIPLSILILLMACHLPLPPQEKPSTRPTVEPRAARARSQAHDISHKKRSGGFLGLHISDVRIDGSKHVRVDAVVKGSDAERLGFKKGDLILRINRRRITNGDSFIMSLWSTSSIVTKRMRRARGANARRGPIQHKIFVRRGDEEVALECGYDDLDRTPAVGQKAPDFTLMSSDGKTTHSLSKMIGDKPVVLIFGSWT